MSSAAWLCRRPRAGALPRQAAAPTERLEPLSSASRSLSPSPAAGGAADPLGDCPAAWERSSTARCDVPPGLCHGHAAPRQASAGWLLGRDGGTAAACSRRFGRFLSSLGMSSRVVFHSFSPPVPSEVGLLNPPLPVSGDEWGALRVQLEPNHALGLSSARGEHGTGGAGQQRLRA